MNKTINTLICILHWLVVPLIATSMVLWPTYSSGLETLQTDPGDPLLNMYVLEHAYQHFTSLNIFRPDRFWSPDYFWPVKETLAWSDHLLGQSIIYGMFRSILSPINAYVYWLSTTLVLNYISIRRALLRISPETRDIWLTIATLTTAFSPAITLQIGHPQLLSLFIIGPILYECHRLLNEKGEDFTTSDWISLSCLLLISGFFNVYTFVYACYGVIICTGIHIFKRVINRSICLRIGKSLILRVGCLSIVGLINLYIYLPYLQTLKSFGNRPIGIVIDNLPKPAGWLLGNDWLLVPPAWTYQSFNPTGQEQSIFPGWGLLILLTATVFTLLKKKKNPGVRNWLITITLMILLTLSFDGKTGWLVMMKILPGSGSLRASSRVAMMIILFSAPCIAITAKNWKLNFEALWNSAYEFTILSASFVSIWAIAGAQYQFSYKKWDNELTAVIKSLKDNDCDVFWYQWRNKQLAYRAHVIAMHAQSRTSIPTANGYSGQFPSDDWPFTNSSGQNAFRWLAEELPQTNHSSHESKLYPKKCITTLSEDNVASITYYEEKALPDPVTILKREGLKIGEDGQILYLSIKNNIHTSLPIWAQLIRDGKSIPARRGDYQITNAIIKNKNLFITDTSLAANDQYIWKVNPKTGILVSTAYYKFK